MTSDGPDKVAPSETVMSFVMPSAETCRTDLRGVFCNHVNFLASRRAAAAYFSSEMIPLDQRHLVPPQAYSYRGTEEQIVFSDYWLLRLAQQTPSSAVVTAATSDSAVNQISAKTTGTPYKDYWID